MSAHCSRPSSYDLSNNGLVVKVDVLRQHLAPIHAPLLVVSITGPYQAGKSAFVSYLTGDNTIAIGNGLEPHTRGVWLYGPYTLNSLKSRWKVQEVPEDQTQVIFIDTEGLTCGDGGDKEREIRLLMYRMLAPYLAISHISILMHNRNLESWTRDALKDFLDVAQRICSGANSGRHSGNAMAVIDVTCGVSVYRTSEVDESGCPVTVRYNGTPEAFESASSFLKQVQTQRFADFQLLVDHFWPLPSFNAEEDIFHQGDGFIAGFKILSQRLISLLDGIPVQCRVSGSQVSDMFEWFLENWHEGLDKLDVLAGKARELAESHTLQRVFEEFVHSTVSEFENNVREKFQHLEANLVTDVRTPNVSDMSTDDMISQCLTKMDPLVEQLEQTSHGVQITQDWRPVWKLRLTKFALEQKQAFLRRLSEGQKEYVLKAVMLTITKAQANLCIGDGKEKDCIQLYQQLEGQCEKLLGDMKSELTLSPVVLLDCQLLIAEKLLDFAKEALILARPVSSEK